MEDPSPLGLGMALGDSPSFIQSSMQEMRQWMMEGVPENRAEWEDELRRKYMVRRRPQGDGRRGQGQGQGQGQAPTLPPRSRATRPTPTPAAAAPASGLRRHEPMEVEVEVEVEVQATRSVPAAASGEARVERPAPTFAGRPAAAQAPSDLRRPPAGASGGGAAAVDNWEEVLPRVLHRFLSSILYFSTFISG